MEKGYRLKLGNKWVQAYRFYGEIMFKTYDDENDPNVAIKLPLNRAIYLQKLAEKNGCNLEIIECGFLSESDQITNGEYLMRRYLK